MNSVLFGQLNLHIYIAFFCLCGEHFASTFVNIIGPFYISERHKMGNRRHVPRLHRLWFTSASIRPTMETDRPMTHLDASIKYFSDNSNLRRERSKKVARTYSYQ